MSDLLDLSKLKISAGRIWYFLYQQDGSRQAMDCADTQSNRLFVSWAQIHDAPPAGPHDATPESDKP
jgi:hypothetical protein